ncbi:iron complex transport system substrate-binding protein [Actinoplanes campanulatus]|uniref:Iron complex transport system substrate-binding protein n=1 Tax=Actinoplanes campanulatus TaxID=113559 RepID=A0A7W5FER1_9ACTN|nr:ABC transporter substrate-binding protein [Actinoplanes campanulatus]MBB3095724.1 iron complex transport system substrate-binding protein [Actinoplanes campanulatus]GGN11092.1 iron ABC transporter substrate-binding protein [Actinoplanes campanulatus]GID36620.1 iron ABC transporter substrate-binding protein [Actinoplanes campanulatus]
MATTPSLPRRNLLLGAAAAGLLAACGDSADKETPDTGTSPAAGGGTFPATVTHQFGSTTLDAAPQAVVSLGWADADALLALGVVPIGILDWFQAWPTGVGPWAQDKLNGATPTVLKGPEINFESVAALRPDFITFTKSDNVEATWEQLEKLAPTLSGPADTPPYGTTLKDQTEMIAAALGRKSEGEALVAANDKALADAKAANPEFHGKSVVVAAAFGGQYGAYTRGDGRVQFMEALGFVNSQKIEDLNPANYYAPISKEEVGLLDADLTVVFGIGGGEELKNDPVLNSIPSAKDGRMLIIDDADLANAFSTNSVLSTPYTIERFVPMVKETLA